VRKRASICRKVSRETPVNSAMAEIAGLIHSGDWHARVLPIAFSHPIGSGSTVLFYFRLPTFAADWDHAFSTTHDNQIGNKITLPLEPKQIAFIFKTSAGEPVTRAMGDALVEGVTPGSAEQKFFRNIAGAFSWIGIPDGYEISYPDRNAPTETRH
jgi:hypothetical protein